MRLLIAVFTLLSFSAHAQWQKPNNAYGTIANGGNFQRILMFPTGCGVPGALNAADKAQKRFAIYGDSCNNKAYLYNPSTSAWTVIGSGGGGGTGGRLDSVYLSSDSSKLYFAYISGAIDSFQIVVGGGTTSPDSLDLYDPIYTTTGKDVKFKNDTLPLMTYKSTNDTSLISGNPKNLTSVEWVTARLGGGGSGGGTTDKSTQTATAGQSAFTFSGLPASANNYDIFINGCYINPSYYSSSGTTITFSAGLIFGDVVDYSRKK